MDTYKVITNTYSGQTVVAYQCGTPAPDITGADVDMLVEVPITKAAFTTTTYIPWIELLGERTTIKAYTSDFSYVTSACLNQLYDEGEAVSVASGWSYDNTALEALDVQVCVCVCVRDVCECARANVYCTDDALGPATLRCRADRRHSPCAAPLALPPSSSPPLSPPLSPHAPPPTLRRTR